jgi:predicted ATPase
MKDKIKIVLTGGPCCGKTTLLNELRKKGHNICGEAAREILEKEPAAATDYENFQTRVLERQSANESDLDDVLEGSSDKLAYLDRSVVDGIAYSRHALNRIPKVFDCHQMKGRYNVILLLDRLPLVQDGLRLESNDAEAERIHDHIQKAYVDYGYFPIRVPIVGTPEQRADYVVELVERLK